MSLREAAEGGPSAQLRAEKDGAAPEEPPFQASEEGRGAEELNRRRLLGLTT